MNIRSLSNILVPVSAGETDSTKKLKSEDTAKDKDPNGQQQNAEEQEHKHLTEEDVDKALAYIKNLPGVKDSQLSVTKEVQNEIMLIVVKDPTGKILRRILPPELYRLSKVDKEQTKGHLLNKVY